MKTVIVLIFILIFSSIQPGVQAAEQKGCKICKMKVESVALGMKEQEALKFLGQPQSRGKYQYNGECTADYSATCKWTKKGLDVIFTANDKRGQDAHISGIIIPPASKVKLKDNIGIGSTEAEVKKVFGKYQTEETKEVSSRSKNEFWIGRDCEAIKFEFKNGKVLRIDIGATYCDC